MNGDKRSFFFVCNRENFCIWCGERKPVDCYQIGISARLRRERGTLFSGSSTSFYKSVDPSGIPFSVLREVTVYFMGDRLNVPTGRLCQGKMSSTADKQKECNRLTGGGNR